MALFVCNFASLTGTDQWLGFHSRGLGSWFESYLNTIFVSSGGKKKVNKYCSPPLVICSMPCLLACYTSENSWEGGTFKKKSISFLD